MFPAQSPRCLQNWTRVLAVSVARRVRLFAAEIALILHCNPACSMAKPVALFLSHATHFRSASHPNLTTIITMWEGSGMDAIPI
ncbi:hypothetical protein AAFF_G00127170 [Aldrovandia affinis]|uniref:Uncharacterized protein n=1 Tax=Aldrovandia affinis TaxID=143900 RepID=A0AAD7T0X8_9TELE|nr:hypothetical protein AAFF_G00127170 [Aldrovandia affinis]